MDAPPIKRHPQITNLRKPIWSRGAVMGISRFPIRPGVYLRNINSARPRGPFFFNRQRGAASTRQNQRTCRASHRYQQLDLALELPAESLRRALHNILSRCELAPATVERMPAV